MPNSKSRILPQAALWILAIILAGAVGAMFALRFSARFQPSPSQSGNGRILKRVQSTGTIRVGYIVWPPTVIQDPNSGKFSGQFVDTIEYIANELGVHIDAQETNWDTFAASLESGRYDVVVAGTYLTISRAKAVAFTRPLFFLGTGALVKKGDTRFKTPDDLNRDGLVIACTQGTGEENWAKGHLPKATVKSIPGPNLDLALLEVVNGRADVALEDTYSVSEFARRQKNVEVLFLDHPLNLTAISWAIPKDDQEWKNFLDASLQYLELTGRLKEFEERYGVQWAHRPID